MPAPDNIYKDDVDFTALALQYPDFANRYFLIPCVVASGEFRFLVLSGSDMRENVMAMVCGRIESMFNVRGKERNWKGEMFTVDSDKHKTKTSALNNRLKPNRQLDFSDPESVRQLTKCLLHRDFNLTIDLPDDRLCPPVPNRFNYILFIQRLLDDTSPEFHEGYDRERQVLGLDM
jgi:hypothetical protein